MVTEKNQVYVCRKCGYLGAFILENGNLALKLEEEWKKGFTDLKLEVRALICAVRRIEDIRENTNMRTCRKCGRRLPYDDEECPRCIIIASSKKNGKTVSDSFTNITYAGGHSAYPEKHTGKVFITENALIFQELTGINEDKSGDFKLHIPFQKIENVSIKSTSEISRLRTILVGPLWSMGMPVKSKFVLIEYIDEWGMKQNPFFNFMMDFGDKKKGQIMRILYDQIKKNKLQKTKTETHEEDHIKVLKLRYVKGEITKEEYKEMKKALEE